MIILAIDIGNSRTKLGAYKDQKLVGIRNMPSKIISPEKIWDEILRTLGKAGISSAQISGAVISSVVPRLTKSCASAIRQHTLTSPLKVTGTLDVGLRILYKNPRALGADRICSSVAAYKKYGGPVVVVDVGT